MAATVRYRVDATDFSRDQFRRRLGWWTDRALEADGPTRWVERFDGGTQLRRRYRWELFAEVGDDVQSMATVIGALPRLPLHRTRLVIESAVPGFDTLLTDALRTRRRDAMRIMVRRCVVDSREHGTPTAVPAALPGHPEPLPEQEQLDLDPVAR